MPAGEFEVVDPDGYVVLIGELVADAPRAGRSASDERP
jgi:hypothetical protein